MPLFLFRSVTRKVKAVKIRMAKDDFIKISYTDKLRGPKWQLKRLEILGRDNATCQKCGDKENTLHVHHRYYIANREPWDYPNELLVTLCATCHKEEEDCAKIGEDMFKSMRYFGYFNTEVRDILNKLIEAKISVKNEQRLDKTA